MIGGKPEERLGVQLLTLDWFTAVLGYGEPGPVPQAMKYSRVGDYMGSLQGRRGDLLAHARLGPYFCSGPKADTSNY